MIQLEAQDIFVGHCYATNCVLLVDHGRIRDSSHSSCINHCVECGWYFITNRKTKVEKNFSFINGFSLLCSKADVPSLII